MINNINKKRVFGLKDSRGLTLIEMIIYLGLFSILIGGVVVAVYQIVQNSGKISNKMVVEEEMNFVLKKVDWALTGATSVTTPLSGTSDTLRVNKLNFFDNPIVIKENSTNQSVEYCTGLCTATYRLTSVNVHVEDLTFQYLPSVGGAPAGIKVTLTIDGVTNTFNKYFRI
ncbi:MAG: type II secretion system GspH family protein [bacterium]|nr:type II secretion system GspH family protein [bacterium]